MSATCARWSPTTPTPASPATAPWTSQACSSLKERYLHNILQLIPGFIYFLLNILFWSECQRVKWQPDEELLHPRVPGVWVGAEDDRQPPASPCWPAAAQAAGRGRCQPPAPVQLPHQVPQLQDRPLQRQIRPDGGPAQGGSRCDQASFLWPLDLQLDNSTYFFRSLEDQLTKNGISLE